MASRRPSTSLGLRLVPCALLGVLGSAYAYSLVPIAASVAVSLALLARHARWIGREITAAAIVMCVQFLGPLRVLEYPRGQAAIDGRFALVWLPVIAATALYFGAENLRAFLRFNLPGALIQLAAAVVGWEWGGVLYACLVDARGIPFA
ncbi:MAG: hypothetical protein AAFP86_05895 [Planctomycetota bacterium]